MSPRNRTIGQYTDDESTADGTPADLPSLNEYPDVRGEHGRLVGLLASRKLVYHRAPCELLLFDPSDFSSTGDLTQVGQENTGGFGTRDFEEFRSELQQRTWLATTSYAEVLLGGVDAARYPRDLPSPADQQSPERAGEWLLGVDAFGLGHYEVHEVDIPYIRRYAPWKESEIIRWEPQYGGYVTPKDGLANRSIAHYLVTVEVEAHGWNFLSEYGQSLVDSYLQELAPVRELLE